MFAKQKLNGPYRADARLLSETQAFVPFRDFGLG